MNIRGMTKRAMIGMAVSGVVLAATFLFAPPGPTALPVAPVQTATPVQTAELVRAVDTVVKIENFTFNQQRVTIKVGTTVTWVNEDDIPHTATSSTKLFNSKTLDTNDKFSFTFTTPGTYEYFCALHPHMKGSIVVEAQ
jgi:amicyanin